MTSFWHHLNFCCILSLCVIIEYTQDMKYTKICYIPVLAGLSTETVCHLSSTSLDTELQKLAPLDLDNYSPKAPLLALAWLEANLLPSSTSVDKKSKHVTHLHWLGRSCNTQPLEGIIRHKLHPSRSCLLASPLNKQFGISCQLTSLFYPL